ncbi:MAG: Ig-like domain repeat protein, partial [Acidobacteriaceae bacterium]
MRYACRLALSLCLLPACSIFAVAQSWQAPTLYPSGNDAPSRIATADLLGTQSSDVVAVTTAHDLVLYANDGTGHLSSSPQTLRENVAAVAAAKFSGTTMDDLLVISSATPTAPLQLMLLPSQGGRVFGAAVAIAPQLALGATCQLNAADFNGDDSPDVLIFCPGSNSLVIGINNGKGNFTFTNVPGFLESGRQIQNVSAGDLDGDGLADIVVQSSPVYSPADARIDVLWGSADGTFSPQLNYVSQPDVTALYIANVDGHASANLVTDSSNSVSVFAGQANRNNPAESVPLQVSPGCTLTAVASGRIVNVKYSLGQDMVAAATCNGQNQLLVNLNNAQVATTLTPQLDLSSGTPVVGIHAEVSSAQGSTVPTGQITLNANGNPVNETLTNGSADFTFHGVPGNNLFTVTYAGDPNTAGAKQYASVVLAGDAAGTNSGSGPQTSIPVSRAPVNVGSNSDVRTMMRVSLPAGTGSLHLPAPATPISGGPVPTAGDTGSSTASSYTLSVPSVPGSTSGLLANTAYTVVSSVAAPSGSPVATQNGFPVSVSFQINSATLGQGTASAPATALSSWSQSSCTWNGTSWSGDCAPDGSGSYPVSIEQDVVAYSSSLTFPASGTYQVAAIMTPTESGAPTQTQIASLSVNDGPAFSRSTLRPMASGSTGASCSPASFSYGTGTTCTITTSCSLNSGDGSYMIVSNPAGLSTGGSLITGRGTLTLTVPVGTYTTTITEITSCGTAAVPGPTILVSKATPSVVLSSSNPTITYGQSVTFSATAQPVGVGAYPTGSITFYVSGTSIGTVAASNGSASISTSTLAAGSYTVTASYSGDSNYTGATSGGVTQTVSKVTPSLSVSCSPNPITYGSQNTTCMTSISGGTTGSETWTINGGGWTTTGLNGSASGFAGYAAGAYTIGVSYSGDSNNNPVSSSTTLTISKVTPSISASCTNPTYPNPTSCTVQVAAVAGGAVPTGSVAYLDNGTYWGTMDLNGSGVAVGVGGAPAGAQTETAEYSGDGNYNAVSTSTAWTEQKATPSISVSCSPNPITYGSQNTTCSTSLTGGSSPTGTETWTINGGAWATTGLNGSAGGFAGYSAGTYTIAVSYSGDGNNNPVSSSTSIAIQKAASSISFATSATTAIVGQSIGVSASVCCSQNGTVQFYDSTWNYANVATSGSGASSTFSASTPGTYQLYASWPGDTNYSAATSTPINVTFVMANSSVSLACTPNPADLGQAVSCAATVSGGANGESVDFLDGATQIGAGTISSGVATFSTTSLAVGTHSLTAEYVGDGTYNPSTSNAVSESINNP